MNKLFLMCDNSDKVFYSLVNFIVWIFMLSNQFMTIILDSIILSSLYVLLINSNSYTEVLLLFFNLFLFFYYAGFSYICLFIDYCFLHFILQPPPPVNDTNPYNVFRPRERPNRLHTRRVSHLLYKLVKHFSWFISISELRGKDLVLTYLTGRFFFINFNLC